MPHKDRDQRLAYLRDWKERGGRPSPVVEARPGLPPYGAMIYAGDGSTVQCHVCGEWFGRLATHLKVHGLDAASYKETYGLKRGTSTDAPAVQEGNRQRAIDREQGFLGRAFAAGESTGRPVGLEARLGQRVEASRARKGTNPRAGEKARTSIGRLLITETGEILYGERWQSQLARALNVTDRTVRRWDAGDAVPKPGIYLDLHRLVTERLADLQKVEGRLKEATAP